MFNFDNTGVTVELGRLIENGVNLWDFEYPVPRPQLEYNGKTCMVDFDKEKFQQKVIDHYRFRQIGQETVGRFLHMFRTKIREIMPYYVQLYEFDAKFRNIEDPLESYNLVEEFKQESRGEGRNTSNSNSTNKFSDTPQGTIANIDMYLTNATKATGEGSDTAESSGESSHTLTRRGNIGVQPLGGEVENIRGAFINIDVMIIEELNDLFLKVY